MVKDEMFHFLWKNKKDKIKQTSMYQDLSTGGLRMVAVKLVIKSLRLAWIKRLLFRDNCNWKVVLDYFFNKHGGLNFLLQCNYDVKYLRHISTFYRVILIAFDEIKNLYNYDQGTDTILFNNKEILVDGKPLLIREWFINGIHTIQQLFNENGQYLTFQELQAKYHCNTDFLQFCQILSAIPVSLKNRAQVLGQNLIFHQRENWKFFLLNETSQINFERYRARDYYCLLLAKKHQSPHTGPERWKRDISLDTENWTDVFKMASKTCKGNKLKEFQFKFIHRIVITKKELFRYGINTDSDCIYCGEPDSINHTFINCKFTKTFTCKVVNWFNTQNGSNFKPDTKETLFTT